MRKFTLPLLLLLLGTAACNSSKEPTGPGATPIEEETFAPELGVDLSKMTRTASGLYLQDLTIGEGAEAKSGRHLEVHYTGRLVNGFTFDSSVGESPIELTLGVRQVIDGWDEGLQGMRVGGSRKLVIPSELAYGKEGAKDQDGRVVIPPHATLIFDVVLVSVRCVGDGGLEKCPDA